MARFPITREAGHFSLGMTNIIGRAVFALGIVLLVLGFEGTDALTSRLARLIEMVPGPANTWMIVLGVMAVCAGLVLAVRETPRSDP